MISTTGQTNKSLDDRNTFIYVPQVVSRVLGLKCSVYCLLVFLIDGARNSKSWKNSHVNLRLQKITERAKRALKLKVWKNEDESMTRIRRNSGHFVRVLWVASWRSIHTPELLFPAIRATHIEHFFLIPRNQTFTSRFFCVYAFTWSLNNIDRQRCVVWQIWFFF